MKTKIILSAVLILLSIGTASALTNGDFTSGTTGWTGFFDAAGSSFTVSSGYAKVYISGPGTNLQLYQGGQVLEPYTKYRLSFSAYSTSGKDMTVYLHKHLTPYTNYGLTYVANLGTTWQTYTTEFTTSGFSGTVSDGRLRFWFTPYVTGADTYYIDNIVLTKLSTTPSVTPALTPAVTPGAATEGLPFKRAMYVNDWDTTFNSAANVDYFINSAAYMNVDTIFILLRYGYFEAARNPSTHASWDSRAGNKYNGMPLLEYTLKQAHAKGIRVEAWFPVNIVYSSSDAEYRLFGPTASPAYMYNQWLWKDGTKYTTIPYRTDIAYSGLQDYEVGMVGWIAQHYPTLDGIHIEEPLLESTSYSPPVRSGVQAKFGYDIWNPPAGKTLTQIKSDINTVQRNNWYNLFMRMHNAVISNKANPDLVFSFNEPNMLYSDDPTMVDPKQVADAGLIDYYVYQAGATDYNVYLSRTRSLNNIITSIPIVTLTYVIGNNGYSNPALFDSVKNACSYGSDAEAVFNWNRADYITINGASIKEWMHNNPPSSLCGLAAPVVTPTVTVTPAPTTPSVTPVPTTPTPPPKPSRNVLDSMAVMVTQIFNSYFRVF